jgi:hypothetical protein
MTLRILLPVVCVLLAPWQCGADVTLLHDDFNGDSLDPAWHVRLDLIPPAAGWEYAVASGSLTVTDVQSYELTTWSSAHVRRACLAPADFTLSCGMSWDSGNNDPAAMQQLRVSLIDTAGSSIAMAMFYDCWVAVRGVIYASIGDAQFQDTDYLPYAGEASIRIERSENVVSVYWDEEEVLTATEASRVDSVDLSFWYFWRTTSFFGTESVDYVTVTAPDTAVESVTWTRIKAILGS